MVNKLEMLCNVIKKHIDKASIFTMNAEREIIEKIVSSNENTDFKIYVSDHRSYENISCISDEFPNVEITPVENNHIKAFIGKTEDGYYLSLFGSSNYTSGGFGKNMECNFVIDTGLDIDNNLKYSNASIIQGILKELNKQLKEYTKKDKILREKISRRPVNFLDAKKYGNQIVKRINDILENKDTNMVNIITKK